MTTRRNRHQLSIGTTSQAYNCTRYSLLCYRAPSRDRYTKQYPRQFSTEFKKKYYLTDKNIRYLLQARQRKLVNMKWRHRYYTDVCSCSFCQEFFRDYCMYGRKNHPAKKGKGRELTSREEMDAYNQQMYPWWF
jgi:hypothetical protein